MKRSTPIPESGELLNLPLGDAHEGPPRAADPGSQDVLPFDATVDEPEVEVDRDEPVAPGATVQLQAGLLDLAVVLSALVLVVVGTLFFDVRLGVSSIAPLLLFAVCFSFLYFVVPLTFWGQTPGMAALALAARSSDGSVLTIRQGILRWAAAVVTVGTCAMPLLLLLGGSSLADRLSHSHVRRLSR